LTSGVGTFSATLTTAGTRTITATQGTATGTSGTITVSATVATHFVMADPTVTAGTGVVFTVTAEDQFNNTATGYTGTVSFTSTDTGASTKLPGASPLNNGVGTFTATLTTAGNQSITATDPNTSGVTGTITSIKPAMVTVVAAQATHFVVSAPSTTVAGSNMLFTVVAEDQFNNTATGFTGNVTFTSTDTSSNTKLPPASPLTSGVGTFSATLTTVGSQTVTATQGTVTGTSNSITVTLSQDHFVLIAPGNVTAGSQFTFTLLAETSSNTIDTSYSGTVHFSSSDTMVSAGNGLPSDTALPGGQGVFTATLKTTGNQTLTAADTVSSTITAATATITVSSGAAGVLGLSPGFYKNPAIAAKLWTSPTSLLPSRMPAGLQFYTGTLFNTYFKLTPAQSGFSNKVTMFQALSAGGGGTTALARQAVAALLNAAYFPTYILPPGDSTFTDLYNTIRNAFLSKNASVIDALAALLEHNNSR
jgi:hypothetical protein